jgi:uncharacterized protein YjbJ (UPF0337 family)
MDKDLDKDLGKQGIEDSARGKVDKFKGRVEDAAGGLIGDAHLQAEGKVDQLKGEIEDTLGKGERKLDRSVDDDL